ncbi:hypothetical protein M404DRAFT_995431 [Pisolithus tinctorius Marx 270]|uniref:Uncharacterized protein n=1 Tax=Pisolithus tinctorius Marx 270 TaxID=870435 RepID=A0A0C3KKV8_PISTI|nr:hypothetical protein M404DRAFT_995431 [Pisolithus tinctorius Marx 270]
MASTQPRSNYSLTPTPTSTLISPCGQTQTTTSASANLTPFKGAPVPRDPILLFEFSLGDHLEFGWIPATDGVYLAWLVRDTIQKCM